MRSWGLPDQKPVPPQMPEPVHGAWIIIYILVMALLASIWL